jgi:transcriptional regulator of arginine metabolism
VQSRTATDKTTDKMSFQAHNNGAPAGGERQKNNLDYSSPAHYNRPMSVKPVDEARQRLQILRELLTQGDNSTQEELVAELARRKMKVTQSTISRDLRRLGAVKAVDSEGSTVYMLPDDLNSGPSISPSGIQDLLIDMRHNGSIIVIRTTPGSASLIARQLDQAKPEGILGTIAGDDTIFVAPLSVKKIDETLVAIAEEFS